MKKKWRNAILSLCGAILAISVATPSLDASNFPLAENVVGVLSNTQNAVWSTLDLAENYAYGSTFNVPKRTLSVGENQVNAKSVLLYPNGTATVNESAVLNAYGYYQLSYTAAVNGKTYLEEHTFFVSGASYSVSNAKSSVHYGAYEYDVDRTALVDANGKDVYSANTLQTERKQYTYC